MSQCELAKYLQKQAFTLVELLIVIAIIAALSGMILAIVASSSDANDAQETKAILYKIAAAVDQFQMDTSAPPLPSGSKSDPLSGSWYPEAVDGTWEKQQLWWRLSSKMAKAAKDEMRDAAEKKSLEVNPYQSDSYMADQYTNQATRRAKVDEIMATISNEVADAYKGTYADVDWAYYNLSAAGSDSRPASDKSKYYGLTYRGKYKSYILAARAAIAKDLEQRKFMTYPCLDVKDVGSEFINDQCIVDAWGQPVIYIAKSTIAVKERKAKSGANPMRYMGVPEQGRVVMQDRDENGLVEVADWEIEPVDESQKIDWNEDGVVDIRDWGNILYYAKPGRAKSFYIASSGSDMLFNCIYSDGVNDDNIELDLKE